jgi:hypothetical protein
MIAQIRKQERDFLKNSSGNNCEKGRREQKGDLPQTDPPLINQLHSASLFSFIPQGIVTADRAVAPLASGGVGIGHSFLAVAPLGANQVQLFAGVGIVARQADDAVLVGMDEVEVLDTIPKTGLGGLLLGQEDFVMAFPAEFAQIFPEKLGSRGVMWRMASETLVHLDRRVDALLGGLVVMAFITKFRALILHSEEAVVPLMIAVQNLMAGGAFLASYSFMDEFPGYLAAVTLTTGFSADRVYCPF